MTHADSQVAIVGYGSTGAALEQRLLACEATVVRADALLDRVRRTSVRL
ncbi:hypothetical protein [Streptomyces sp. NPDC102360]